MAIVAIEGQTSSRSVELLLGIVGDRALELDTRGNAVAILRDVNPAALSRATPDLIRQLGSGSLPVRQNAVSLLSTIVEDARAEMPILTKLP
jgi:hypothetical protein